MSNLLVKRFFFLLNAAFAMAILDLISQVHLQYFTCAKEGSYGPDDSIKERNPLCPTTPQRNPEFKANPTVRTASRENCIR
jgi:hypothetical protein